MGYYSTNVYTKQGGNEMVVASGGTLTIESGGIVSGFTTGTVYFVDSVSGLDTNTGKTWLAAFKTIAAAVAAASAGDSILIKGSFTEAVTIALAKTGLMICGIGTGPNQATWTGAADAVCLTINATNCIVKNIKFRPPAYSAGTPAAILLGGAGYTKITQCRFQGKTSSYNAIYSPVCNSDNVEISDCEFIYLNTATHGAAILGVEAGGLSYSGWKILRNIFNSCVTAVNINGRVCLVEGNHFNINGIAANGEGGAVCTLALDLSGTSSYGNMVHGNYLGGTYSATLYKVGASGDDWAGNYNIAGLTAANPS